jgi:hypothetical protein
MVEHEFRDRARVTSVSRTNRPAVAGPMYRLSTIARKLPSRKASRSSNIHSRSRECAFRLDAQALIKKSKLVRLAKEMYV